MKKLNHFLVGGISLPCCCCSNIAFYSYSLFRACASHCTYASLVLHLGCTEYLLPGVQYLEVEVGGLPVCLVSWSTVLPLLGVSVQWESILLRCWWCRLLGTFLL